MYIVQKILISLLALVTVISSFTICICISKLEDNRLRRIAENGGTTYWEKYIYDDTAPQVQYMNHLREELSR